MPIRVLCFLSLVTLATAAFARDREVTIVPVSVSMKPFFYSTTGGGGNVTSIVTPEAAPTCPDGSNEVGPRTGSVVRCQWNSRGAGSLIRGTGVSVFALITTAKHERFNVWMVCDKQYGVCPQPQEGTAYHAQLNEESRWLRDYAKRPVRGGMKIRLQLDGEKQISYMIVKVQPVP